MATHGNSANNPSGSVLRVFRHALFTTDHKAIGIQYLSMALFSVFFGMGLSALMRMQLGSAGAVVPDRYAALTLLHGSLMVFFVLTAAPQFGFGYFFLPIQIGAREMAFPFLSALSSWMTFASLVGMAGSFFLDSYSGMSLWICSAACFCLAALLSSVNFCVTAADLRTQGMALSRLPLTVWSWLITAILSLLIFSILLAACAFLLSDRFVGTRFFPLPASALAAPALVWQRWFWFFAQAEVYVAILPCFGFVSHLLSIFSRKPVWAERMAVLALCGVGLCGFCIWGFHMFSSGLNPYAPLAFSKLAGSLGVPAAFLIATWIGTLWKARPQLTTSMLFALGFISLFLSGAASGLFLSFREASNVLVTDQFITAHFHLVMGVAATFAILAAFFFWFPKMFGRRLNEPLGKVHFWLTLFGVYCIFIPMQWSGSVASGKLAAFSAIAAAVTIAAQLLFLANFFGSVAWGEKSSASNPWRAPSLEWFVPSPPPPGNFGDAAPVVYRGAYSFNVPFAGGDFLPQHLGPDMIVRHRS